MLLLSFFVGDPSAPLVCVSCGTILPHLLEKSFFLLLWGTVGGMPRADLRITAGDKGAIFRLGNVWGFLLVRAVC